MKKVSLSQAVGGDSDVITRADQYVNEEGESAAGALVTGLIKNYTFDAMTDFTDWAEEKYADDEPKRRLVEHLAYELRDTSDMFTVLSRSVINPVWEGTDEAFAKVIVKQGEIKSNRTPVLAEMFKEYGMVGKLKVAWKKTRDSVVEDVKVVQERVQKMIDDGVIQYEGDMPSFNKFMEYGVNIV